MLLVILEIIIFLMFIGVPFYLSVTLKKDKKELRKRFSEINIGEKIECRITNLSDNPFEEKHYDYTVEIIDKRINENDVPYIKYRYEDGSETSEKFVDFLMFVNDRNKK